MKRIILCLIVAALIAAVSFPLIVSATGGRFPYWTEGARSESEQATRLQFLDRKLDQFRETKTGLRDRKVVLRSRLRKVDRRIERINNRLARHRMLKRAISAITGYTVTLYNMRLCESTNNYTAHSPSGTYHGAYQYDYATFGGDAHLAPWWRQDERTAQYLRNGEASRWPNC